MIPWPRSLTVRILLLEILTILAVLALVPWMTISMLHQTIDSQQEHILDRQTDLIIAGLKSSPAGMDVALAEPWRSVYDKAFDGRAYLIVDARSRVRAQSIGAAHLPLAQIDLSSRERPFHINHFIGVTRKIRAFQSTLWVITIQDETEPGAIIDDIARTFLWRYVGLLVVLLVSLPAINAVLIRQLFRSVRRTSERAASIGPQSLELRLDELDLPLEVSPLAQAINRLVDRLEESLRQQRTFIGNVVHELRTPLATLRIQIERLERDEDRAMLNHSVMRISHVISQLRDLAELETFEGQKEEFELNDLARRVVTDLAPQVYEAGDKIELSIADREVIVCGRSFLLELALRNLIDNAIRHTPAGTSIEVAVDPVGSISVRDNGPGIEREGQDRIRTRFWRADRTRSDTAGLGLSIVDRICAVHSAKLEVKSWPGRGSCFSIILPVLAELTEFEWVPEESPKTPPTQ